MESSSSSGGGGWISPEEFHTLLMERKAERKAMIERQRQEDLKSIASMNAIAVIHLTGLLLLPPEIWQMILAYVDDPKDLWNLYHVQSHSLLQGVMEATKIQDILFPLVVRYVDHLLPERKTFDAYIYGATPALRKIRNLSKNLRKAVDYVVENNPERGLRFKRLEKYLSYKAQALRLQPGFRSNDETIRILDEVTRNATMPNANFHLKTLSVRVSARPPFIEASEWDFGRKLTSLLEVEGLKTQNFKFEITWWECGEWNDDNKLASFRQYYISLRQWTAQMPNLRWLIIKISTGLSREAKEKIKENPNVKSFLAQNPFPTLRSLEIISLEWCENVIPAVDLVEAILSSNTHVKKITFPYTSFQFFQRFSPNLLATLNLSAFTSFSLLGWPFHEQTDDVIGRALKENEYHLTRLDLHVQMACISLNELLRFLQNFTNLQYVCLYLRNPKIGMERIQMNSLPNLCEFKCVLREPIISFAGEEGCLSSFFSFHFLVMGQRLRNLELSIHAYESNCISKLKFHLGNLDHEGTIDFWDPRKNLGESNIWDVFPELEHVKLFGEVMINEEWKTIILTECHRSERIERNISLKNEFWKFVKLDG